MIYMTPHLEECLLDWSCGDEYFWEEWEYTKEQYSRDPRERYIGVSGLFKVREELFQDGEFLDRKWWIRPRRVARIPPLEGMETT